MCDDFVANSLMLHDNVQRHRLRLETVHLHPRQELILSHLQTGNYAEVKELAAALDVDASTIRRDLQTLVKAGNVERVHGGVRLRAIAADEITRDYPLTRAHFAIASAARGFLDKGGVVILGAGPISDRISVLLFDVPDLLVHTNSLKVAEVLSRNGVRVFLAGGELRPGGLETTGSATVAYFEEVHADWAFLECDGVHPYAGFTLATPWHVAANRAMLAAAARRCIMAPSASFGSRHVGFLADVASADLVITDDALPDGDLPAFAGRVVRAASDPIDDWRVDLNQFGS
jgi:DeoR/GlpR family transcriptional regulator of sugar metabolism